MSQDHEIYKVLLELKESAGKTSAKLDDIKLSIDKQAKEHDDLAAAHNELRDSHNSYKGKILLVSGFVGSVFGAIGTWLWNYITGNDK